MRRSVLQLRFSQIKNHIVITTSEKAMRYIKCVSHFRINWAHLLEKCEENSMKVYETFARDDRCKPLRFLPKNSEHILTYLTSFPGSGNTWTRHLIQQASGIYTGSVYGDGSLFSAGILSCFFIST